MKKAKITLNGVTKIIEISEEFHTQFRILEEMAVIAQEESPFHNIPEHLKKVPLVCFPKEIFEDTKADEVFQKMSDNYDKELIKVVNKAFDTNIEFDYFITEGLRPSKEDLENDIVIVENCESLCEE